MQPPVVIMVGTQSAGNAGAAARGAANFGVAEMRFVRPACDVKSKEAKDRAVHAKPVLEAARLFPDLKSALEGTSLSVGTTARTAHARNHFLRKPTDIREYIATLAGWDGQVAYVFGPEDAGLANEDVNLLDHLVTVPTSDYASLNVAHAVTLVCYEHFRAAAPSISPERTLEPGALQALHQAWDDLAEATDDREWRKTTATGVWRKVIGRAMPDTYEVHNMMGILTNTLKRFGHPRYATPVSEKVLADRGLKVDPAKRGDQP
jgi:tRNA/rRNA methyltransferase